MTAPSRDESTSNPLLAAGELPRFADIEPAHIEPAVRGIIDVQRAALAEAKAVEAPTLEWLETVEAIHENVQKVWGPVSHLNSVASTPALREAFNRCLPLVTEFETELGQDSVLYERYVMIAETLTRDESTEAAVVEHSLRDFRLAGVALGGAEKERFRAITLALADLAARFEQNLMDATDAFAHVVLDAEELAGLPESVVERARSAAAGHGIEGWRLVLDPPTYQAVMTHADSRGLRELYYRAWVTRASALGPEPGRWDNGPLIDEMLRLRREAARLVGFDSYAELSLATKMAGSAREVLEFLGDLGTRSRPRAAAELAGLTELAGSPLAAWDVAYYAEKQKDALFGLSEEALRAYFPLPRVLAGLFSFTERLFGVSIRRREASELWHPSVESFEIVDGDGRSIGAFLTDLYARKNKRGGAWMDSARNRSKLGGTPQRPIAYVVCNFEPPHGGADSMLTHGDVVTLFHEFGHALHHLLTEIDWPSVGGINGVEWDAVELPSQFLENFAWQPDVLRQISAHRESGEPLPDNLIERLLDSRRHLAGLAMVRQLEFALFDFELHAATPPPSGDGVGRLLEDVRARVAVVEAPEFNRFQNTFSHIFGGGYAAGYYSYKWAEVLAADAFAAFVEAGVFDAATAERFRSAILATGGSRTALESFVEFRGRAPELGPLLAQCGIGEDAGRA